MANTTSLKLPEKLKDKVADMAKGVAQTPHAYMVEAIAERVARDEKHKDFLKAARESAKDVERTGLLYAHDDVWRYIRARVAGKRIPKPRPLKRRSNKR